METKVLTLDDILGVDVEMTNSCNLKCPLCMSQLNFNGIFKPKCIDIQRIEDLLDSMKSLKLVSIAGDASEPTLHPEILEFLDYLKKRDVEVEFYTNASLWDDDWWTELNKHFGPRSTVYFTICGTTQELHSKYRVGSNLEDVINHALAFRKDNPNANDFMQYIMFEYNNSDSRARINKILGQFSHHGILNTDPVAERFDLGDMLEQGLCSTHLFSFRYRMILSEVIAKRNRRIDCYSLRNRYVRIDPDLVVSPCVCYRIYNKESFLKDGKMDYTDICSNKCDFCLECDSEMVDFLDRNDRDAFYMC